MEVVQLVINGTTKFSMMVARLVEMEGVANVVAYTTLRRFINEPTFDGKEIVPLKTFKTVLIIKKSVF